MLPEIILHNSISLDGSLTNFDVNMELHYVIAGNYKPDAHLIGSNTITTGIDLYGKNPLSPEEKDDFIKPKRDKRLPLWIIIDTRGVLYGKIHEVRRSKFCRDIIVLLSQKTPRNYRDYLEERDIDFLSVGEEKINLTASLEILYKRYHVKKIVTDCGRILGNLLLDQGLVQKISLLIHPVIVGITSYTIFKDVHKRIRLQYVQSDILKDRYIWMEYKVIPG
jgi:2,5-diamino-6-(ribosylamino)-4(3H)-pyrimidinone 5'-phosphate reductase